MDQSFDQVMPCLLIFLRNVETTFLTMPNAMFEPGRLIFHQSWKIFLLLPTILFSISCFFSIVMGVSSFEDQNLIYIYIYIFFFSLAFCVIVFRLHFFSHARSNLFLLSSSLIFGQVFLLVNGSTDVNLFLCHGIYLFKFKKHTHEKGGEVLIQIYIVHHKHHSNFLKFDSVYILNNSRNTIFFL